MRRIHFGMIATLLCLVAADDVQPIGPPPLAEQDRRSDLAGLRTVLAFGDASGIAWADLVVAKAWLTYLEAEDAEELNEEERVTLTRWLDAVGLAS
jgi:hypothetical protein